VIVKREGLHGRCPFVAALGAVKNIDHSEAVEKQGNSAQILRTQNSRVEDGRRSKGVGI